MRGLRRVDHPDNFELDSSRKDIEQPPTRTEQHRDLMDLQFVQHARFGSWIKGSRLEVVTPSDLSRWPARRAQRFRFGPDIYHRLRCC